MHFDLLGIAIGAWLFTTLAIAATIIGLIAGLL
jgi:hypothetical protein